VGEKQNQPFQLSFNASFKVVFLGSRVTSGGGSIVMRELHKLLGLSELPPQRLTNPRSRDAESVWGPAGQDRSAPLANRVGERLVDADFGVEGTIRG